MDVAIADQVKKVGVLIDLDHIDVDALGELIEDAWVSQAPPKLVGEFEANNQD
ncbi:MAG: hypothetical protein KDB86_04150 [Actinobacteria bacterium]|nr:hypothetical protein [Actinomycetota bacterium]